MKSDTVLSFDNTSTGSTIELLTIEEVAEILKISIPTVRRIQRARQLPFYKVSGSVRFLKSDIQTYLKKQRVGPIE